MRKIKKEKRGWKDEKKDMKRIRRLLGRKDVRQLIAREGRGEMVNIKKKNKER